MSKNEINIHVANKHQKELEFMIMELSTSDEEKKDTDEKEKPDRICQAVFEKFKCSCDKESKKFVVILFYHYTNITESELEGLRKYQEAFCVEYRLRGKLKFAREGVNGTLEGCECAIERYTTALLSAFPGMCEEDVKRSAGEGSSFDELRVSVCDEICTMGVASDEVTCAQAGRHLTPRQFHQFLQENFNKEQQERDGPLLLDCRNFYESKIGKFAGALTPDIRKFSYFPEYVARNREMFRRREVLMYCTGGIRCERASAYIKQNTDCQQVYQLKGGIHKYLEELGPESLYEGKLFVFDKRMTSHAATSRPISKCAHCGVAHDRYGKCGGAGCHQLVLICDKCRSSGRTRCCDTCGTLHDDGVRKREECECTRNRQRVPLQR